MQKTEVSLKDTVCRIYCYSPSWLRIPEFNQCFAIGARLQSSHRSCLQDIHGPHALHSLQGSSIFSLVY